MGSKRGGRAVMTIAMTIALVVGLALVTTYHGRTDAYEKAESLWNPLPGCHTVLDQDPFHKGHICSVGGKVSPVSNEVGADGSGSPVDAADSPRRLSLAGYAALLGVIGIGGAIAVGAWHVRKRRAS